MLLEIFLWSYLGLTWNSMSSWVLFLHLKKRKMIDIIEEIGKMRILKGKMDFSEVYEEIPDTVRYSVRCYSEYPREDFDQECFLYTHDLFGRMLERRPQRREKRYSGSNMYWCTIL
jgi:hypothetical protein